MDITKNKLVISDFINIVNDIRKFIKKYSDKELDEVIEKLVNNEKQSQKELILEVISKFYNIEIKHIIKPFLPKHFQARQIFIIFAKKELLLTNNEIAFIIKKSISVVKRLNTEFNKMDRNSKIDKKLFFNDYDEIVIEYNKIII